MFSRNDSMSIWDCDLREHLEEYPVLFTIENDSRFEARKIEI